MSAKWMRQLNSLALTTAKGQRQKKRHRLADERSENNERDGASRISERRTVVPSRNQRGEKQRERGPEPYRRKPASMTKRFDFRDSAIRSNPSQP